MSAFNFGSILFHFIAIYGQTLCICLQAATDGNLNPFPASEAGFASSAVT
jgi:hypothetical protein